MDGISMLLVLVAVVILSLSIKVHRCDATYERKMIVDGRLFLENVNK